MANRYFSSNDSMSSFLLAEKSKKTVHDEIKSLYSKTQPLPKKSRVQVKRPCIEILEEFRKVRETVKDLDAPDLYLNPALNLLTCNKNGLLSVALGESLYLLNLTNFEIDELVIESNEPSKISSLAFSPNGKNLAIGFANGIFQVYQLSNKRLLLTLQLIPSFQEYSQVSSIAWRDNKFVAIGTNQGSLYLASFRENDTRTLFDLVTLVSYLSEEPNLVNTLSWNSDGRLLAMGSSNENVRIISVSQSGTRINLNHILKINHNAPVNALAWSPFEPTILATGAGVKKPALRLWDIPNQTNDHVHRIWEVSQEALEKPTLGTWNTKDLSSSNCIVEAEADAKITHLLWSNQSYSRYILSFHGEGINDFSDEEADDETDQDIDNKDKMAGGIALWNLKSKKSSRPLATLRRLICGDRSPAKQVLTATFNPINGQLIVLCDSEALRFSKLPSLFKAAQKTVKDDILLKLQRRKKIFASLR